MAIVNNGLVKVRVRGIDSTIRDLARTDAEHMKAVRKGIVDAAEYLLEMMQRKFGVYQATGGTGGGKWERLKYETNAKKLRKFGFSNKPLIATGSLKDSLTVLQSEDILSGTKKTLAASVGSLDPKMIHHVYGAPRRNVPPRDLMLVTAVEEADACRDKIIDAIWKAYR